jgi:hypothetical protein
LALFGAVRTAFLTVARVRTRRATFRDVFLTALFLVATLRALLRTALFLPATLRATLREVFLAALFLTATLRLTLRLTLRFWALPLLLRGVVRRAFFLAAIDAPSLSAGGAASAARDVTACRR